MSNVAGKAYAMSLVTPIRWYMVLVNKFIFWLAGTRIFRPKLDGLVTLSMIHYARWAIVRGREFPRLSSEQPPEDLRYAYMFFLSNFNGSWAQYVDSFSAAIPSGLNLLWFRNVGWPKSVPETPFHAYVIKNQIWTEHYYNSYPMAASNDVKAAQRVRDRLLEAVDKMQGASPQGFQEEYDAMLLDLQGDLGAMGPTPVVSLATERAAEHRGEDH